MARRAVIGGGGLNPFGVSSAGFSMFELSSAVDPSREAALQLQKVETDYQMGLATDEQYLAALKAYRDALDVNTSSYYNAVARVAEFEYSVKRNLIVNGIQKGTKTWAELIDYDRAALVGVNPDSDVYRDRQGRLWDAQQGEFSEAEQDIAEDVRAGRMTYVQAQMWYEEQRAKYVDNPDLVETITGRVKDAQEGAKSEADQKILDDWSDGKVDLATILAYATQVQAEEPGTERARNWAENADLARKQGIEASLKYRYDLTEEYRDLELLVKGGEARNDPAKVKQAKNRMAEIKKMVSGLAGGWVVEADIIRNLNAQQAKVTKGTPKWYDLQSQIDYYKGRAAADQLLHSHGITIGLPGVKSESQADVTVGETERAVKPTKTLISMAAMNAGGGGGGGGGGRGGSSGGGRSRPTAPIPSNASPAGRWLSQITDATQDLGQGQARYMAQALKPGEKLEVVTGTTQTGQTGRGIVTYKATGLPKDMDAWRWDKLYDAFAKALRENDTQWTDPLTGVRYFLPTDPKARATLLSNMDKTNIAVLEDDLIERIKKGMATKEATNKLLAATENAHENRLYLLTNEGQAVDTAGDMMRDTEERMKFLATGAKTAIDGGDYETAWELFRQSNFIINDPRLQQTLAILGGQATQTVAEAREAGVYLPEGLKSEFEGVTGDMNAWIEGLADKSGLEDVAKLFDPKAGFFQLDPQGNPMFRIEADGTSSLMLANGVARVYNDATGKIDLKKLEAAGRLPDGSPDYEVGSNMVGITLKTGGKYLPVLKKYSVGTVGYMMVEGKQVPITGKLLTITMPDGTTQTLANDPFDADSWVDITKGTALKWRAPSGATGFSFDQNGNIAFLMPSGTQTGFDKVMGKGNTQGFQFRVDPKTGTYSIWATDPTDPNNPKLIQQTAGAAESLLGGPLAFTLDSSNLSADQKLAKNLGLTGAFVGMGSGDILDYGIGLKGYAPLGIAPGLTARARGLPGASALGTIVDSIARRTGDIISQITTVGNIAVTPAKGIAPSGRKRAGGTLKPAVTLFDLLSQGQDAMAKALGTVGIEVAATPVKGTRPGYSPVTREAIATLKPLSSPLAKKTLASQTKAKASTTKKRATTTAKRPTPRKATAKKGQVYSPIKKPPLTAAQKAAQQYAALSAVR